jgi:hypothetical protein
MVQPTVEPKPLDEKGLQDHLAESDARKEQRMRRRRSEAPIDWKDVVFGKTLTQRIPDVAKRIPSIPGVAKRIWEGDVSPVVKASPLLGDLPAIKEGVPEGFRALGAITEGVTSAVGGPFESETGLMPLKWGQFLKEGRSPLGVIPRTKEEALFGKVWASPEWGRAKPESVEATKDIAKIAFAPLGALKDPETQARLGRSYKDLWQGFESRPMSEQVILGLIDPVGAAITAPVTALKGLRAAPGIARGALKIPGMARRFVTPKAPVPQQLPFADFMDQVTPDLTAVSPMQDLLRGIPGQVRGIPGSIKEGFFPGKVPRMEELRPRISKDQLPLRLTYFKPGRGIQIPIEARETLPEQYARGLGAYPKGIARGFRRLRGQETDAEELERATRGTDFSWAGEFATDVQLLKIQKLADILRKAKTVSSRVVPRLQAIESKETAAKGMKAAAKVTTGAREKGHAFKGEYKGTGNLRVGMLDHEKSIWTLDEFNTPAKRGQFLEEILGEAGIFGSDPSRARLRAWEHINAMDALEALMEHGTVPTNSEALLLERVFGGDFTKAIISKRPWQTKAGDLFRDIINMPRANISSFDVSFLLRQGGMMFPSRMADVRASTKLALQVMAPGGERTARRLQYEMMNIDKGRLWEKYIRKGGLFQHRLGPISEVAVREEAFLSHLAGKILPWVGASERGYATFLNKLRWDVMDDMVKRVEATLPVGKEIDDDQLKAIGSYINSMTGRGPMPEGSMADMVSTVMNAFLFSPRLLTSRIAAPINALKYTIGPRLPGQVVEGLPEKTNFIYSRAIAGDPAARAAYQEMSSMVAKQMAAWLITGGTIMGLAKMAQDSGAPIQVTVDPRSPDFGKIRVGNTRYDIWSGYSQISRAMASAITGEIVSSQTGQVRPISQEENIGKFLTSKFSPTIGIGRDYNLHKPLRLISRDETTPRYGIGQGYFGEDRDILKDIKDWKGFLSADEQSFWTNVMTPLFIRDVAAAIEDSRRPFNVETDLAKIDVFKDHPSLVKPLGFGDIGARDWGGIAGAAVGGALGLGIQTYRTTDDIARAVTADQPGGPRDYLLLHDFEQDRVDDIRSRYEESRGITRTQGFGAELDRIEARRESNMADLVKRAPGMRPSQVRDSYGKIRDEARISKTQAMRSEYGEEADPRRMELKRAQMSPSRRLVQDFYDSLDREQERRGVTSLDSEAYHALLSRWEANMRRRWEAGDSAGIAAIYALKMGSHKVEIPDVVLQMLSPVTRRNYASARRLRDLYTKGDPELKSLFTWEQEMYTTE